MENTNTMENANTNTHTYIAGDDEASLLAARRLCGQHALSHRAPDPRHEHHPALHEGECLWEDQEGVVLGKMIIRLVQEVDH